MSNASRQRTRRATGPRPPMTGVCVSRWVQAAVDERATEGEMPASEAWEAAGEAYAGHERQDALTLTARGARILVACAACKREFNAGQRVKRAGDFAACEECAT